MKDLIKLNPEFIDECKAIVTESVFTSRWSLVEGYWNLGKRIREETKINQIPTDFFCNAIALKIGLSERTVWYSVQAYDKYPDLDKIPDGKNISWWKLTSKYLPESTTKKKERTPRPPLFWCEEHGKWGINQEDLNRMCIHNIAH